MSSQTTTGAENDPSGQMTRFAFSALAEHSPSPMMVLGNDLQIIYANRRAVQVFDMDGTGRGSESFPSLLLAGNRDDHEINAFIAQLHHSVRNGEVATIDSFKLSFGSTSKKQTFQVSLQPISETGGSNMLLCFFSDVSVQVEVQQSASRAAEQFQLALSSARLGYWSWDEESNLITLSAESAAMFGANRLKLTRTELRTYLHPDDLERVKATMDDCIHRRSLYDIEYRLRADEGKRWVSVKGKPVLKEDGSFAGFHGVMQDITERKKNEAERAELFQAEQDARGEAQALYEVGQALGSGLDLQTTVQKATDEATRLTKAKFGAFFYNVLDEHKEAYVLYSLSGAPREAFQGFGLPRNTEVFAPTFRGEGVVRVDDITRDSRYGKNAPHHGMPAGHLPVRSYLAVPVISRSGQVLGGLFFGHPEPAIFTARAERIAQGIALQAAAAMDNAALYQRAQRTAERLHFSMAALNLGLWNWDMASDRIIISDRTADIYGLPHGVKITRTEMRKVLHPDEQERARKAVEEAIAGHKDYDIEYRINHPRLGLRWVAAKGRLVKADDGQITGMMGVVQDITERKYAEIQLRNQRDVLEQIVQGVDLREILETLTRNVEEFTDRNLVATILLMDGSGLFLSPAAGSNCPPLWKEYISKVPVGASEGSCGSSAFSRERVVVKDIATDPRWEKYRDTALKCGLRACWSTPILSSSGEVLGTFAIYYQEPGEPTAHELEIVDVTTRTAAIAIERKHSEAALQASQKQLAEYAQTLEARVAERTTRLQETIAELEAFSYSVSHDLRAPLRAMQGYTQALLTDYQARLEPEAAYYLQRLGKNAERLELLVRDILAYSKVAKEQVELTPVSLEAFLDDLLSLSPHLQHPHARVEIEKPLPVVLAHEAYLSQVVSNLLGNAVKFVKAGVVPEIRIYAAEEGDCAKISIKDNGFGIDPAHFERIFQIFGRVYPDKDYDGTGIGLAIVKKAVERMGGTLGVDSRLGEGSTFWFTLRIR